MKKIIPIFFVVFLCYFYLNKEQIVIPEYAIRFRIIANSDTIADQNLKREIKDDVTKVALPLMQNVKTSTEAKEILKNNLPLIQNIIAKYTDDFQISLGQNFFPAKEYHGLSYPSGNYESLVITLGGGTGKNWWCVMFPPLCLLEAKEEETENIEYRFLIKEILTKYNS